MQETLKDTIHLSLLKRIVIFVTTVNRPNKIDPVSETINKGPELERFYNELLDFRKLMLCYRLVHYEDELSNIKISLINRDEELSYPLLQLFYGTDAFEEIKTALEILHKATKD
jgi:hypothetical protein